MDPTMSVIKREHCTMLPALYYAPRKLEQSIVTDCTAFVTYSSPDCMNGHIIFFLTPAARKLNSSQATHATYTHSFWHQALKYNVNLDLSPSPHLRGFPSVGTRWGNTLVLYLLGIINPSSAAQCILNLGLIGHPAEVVASQACMHAHLCTFYDQENICTHAHLCTFYDPENIVVAGISFVEKIII